MFHSHIETLYFIIPISSKNGVYISSVMWSPLQWKLQSIRRLYFIEYENVYAITMSCIIHYREVSLRRMSGKGHSRVYIFRHIFWTI